MLTELLAKELARLAAQKLSEVKVDDAARAIKTLRHAAGGAALVPGLGVFGVLGLGLVVGAGVGVLLAPRSGKETREALRDATRQRIALLRAKFGGHAGGDPAGHVSEAEVREPSPPAEPGGSRTAN